MENNIDLEKQEDKIKQEFAKKNKEKPQPKSGRSIFVLKKIIEEKGGEENVRNE